MTDQPDLQAIAEGRDNELRKEACRILDETLKTLGVSLPPSEHLIARARAVKGIKDRLCALLERNGDE